MNYKKTFIFGGGLFLWGEGCSVNNPLSSPLHGGKGIFSFHNALKSSKTIRMDLITTTTALQEFCDTLVGVDFVTVDTEFMRERSYYSKLCLIQLGAPDLAVAVDPLAEGIDLKPLFDLLHNPDILKVFHAARQDIEIFVNMTGQVPAPIFDTQVAGMVCGFGEAASYQTLVQKLANATIDKTSRFTDWARRPLTPAQIEYALGDVTYLRLVYKKLNDKLEKTGRMKWVSEEMHVLTSLTTYQNDPMASWKRLKLRTDKASARAVLRELAAWRELEAQKNNVPRARIVGDNTLLEIASHPPKNEDALERMRGLGSGFSKSVRGKAILEAVQRGLSCSADDCPSPPAKRMPLPKGARAVLDLLKVLLLQVSDKEDVATKLIASSADLDLLASEDAPAIKTLAGWRYQIFGKTAEALKRGELALVVEKGKVKAIKTQS